MIVPGAEGYLTVLGEHAPLMTTLKPGFVTVDRQGGTSHATILWPVASPTSRDAADDPCRGRPSGKRVRGGRDRGAHRGGSEVLSAAEGIDEKAVAQQQLDTWKNLLLESASLSTVH